MFRNCVLLVQFWVYVVGGVQIVCKFWSQRWVNVFKMQGCEQGRVMFLGQFKMLLSFEQVMRVGRMGLVGVYWREGKRQDEGNWDRGEEAKFELGLRRRGFCEYLGGNQVIKGRGNVLFKVREAEMILKRCWDVKVGLIGVDWLVCTMGFGEG